MRPGDTVPVYIETGVLQLPKLTRTLDFRVPYRSNGVAVTPLTKSAKVIPRGQAFHRVEFEGDPRLMPSVIEVLSGALNKQEVGSRVYVQLTPEQVAATNATVIADNWVLCTVGSPNPVGPTPEEKTAKKDAYKARQHTRRKTAWEKLLDNE